MQPANVLRRKLEAIDKRGYKAYKQIEGAYRFPAFDVFVDHVQGDPFAAPSKIRVRMARSVAGFPESLVNTPVRRIAFQDFLIRQFHQAIRRIARGNRGTGKSGLFSIDVGGQEVLERTALRITDDWVEARFQMGLPAAGRTVLGQHAIAMFFEELPRIVETSLKWDALSSDQAFHFVNTIENYDAIQHWLLKENRVAFVADDAILPRESGASDRPMPAGDAVPFHSPPPLRRSISLPNPLDGPNGNQRTITGMAVPPGVTLIVGGGYHGKSTLLRALERGVYPHIPGDGREYVVTLPSAVKIRAEDGRRVEQVDISPFITNLPFGRTTTDFCTEDASGSTSQAANIVEALEAGSRLLLVDEDTSATNFMVRDARMQALVRKDHEPITPFIDRVQEMYRRFGVSTILVMGGSGDYLDVADTVIMMHNYQPEEVTARARQVAQQFPTHRQPEAPQPWERITPRIPLAHSLDASRGKKEVKIDAKGREMLQYGREMIDLRYLEQLVDVSQTRAIGMAIYHATRRWMPQQLPLAEILDALERWLETEGLEALAPFRKGEEHPGNFARPRRFEIAAALNRMRQLRMKQRR